MYLPVLFGKSVLCPVLTCNESYWERDSNSKYCQIFRFCRYVSRISHTRSRLGMFNVVIRLLQDKSPQIMTSIKHELEPAAQTQQLRLCRPVCNNVGHAGPQWASSRVGETPTRNSYSSSTSRSNMHSSPVGWLGPAGPAGPVQFPPLPTPAAPTSASFASPSALIPWAMTGRGEALSSVSRCQE